MAGYEIKHTCGHTENVQLYGPGKERERKIAWLETLPCRECEAKAKAEQAAADGMAELKGTEKQVSWALDIRSGMVRDLNDMFEREARRNAETATEEEMALFRANAAKAVANIKAVEEAKWFIDNRSLTISKLFNAAFFLSE